MAAGIQDLLNQLLGSQGDSDPTQANRAALARARARLARARADLEGSPAKIAQAQQNLQAAQSSGQGVAEARAELEQAKAAREQARLDRLQAKKQIKDSKTQKGSQEAGKLGAIGKFAGLGDIEGLALTGARAAAGDPVAMIELAVKGGEMAMEQIEKAQEQAKKATAQMGKAWASETAGGAGAGMMGAGEEALKAFGPAGETASQVLRLGRVAFEATDKLRDWTKGLQQSNFQFAEFSQAMTAVQVDQEMWEVRQSRKRGMRRAEDAEKLAKAMQRVEEQLSPLEDEFANLKNKVGVELLGFFSEILDKRREWFNKGILIGSSVEEMAVNSNGFGTDASAAARKHWAEAYGRPARFNAAGGLE